MRRNDHFYRHARLDLRVWRYMDGWKFEHLINQRALYFRRSDKLEDEMEGKYAESNRRFSTDLWNRFVAANSVQHNRQAQEEDALKFRYFAFINCWHLNRLESASMWNAFCKTPNSLAIVSTVRKVASIVQQRKGFALGRVHYEYQTVPRPEWSRFGPHFFKDPKFFEEKEFRVIVLKDGENPYADVDLEKDAGVCVPCDPASIINEVVVHPSASYEFRDRIKQLLRDNGILGGVHRSRLTMVSEL